MTLLALRNSIAILIASLGVAILGLVALDRLPVDLFPNINLPIINVGTIYTGAGVLDIEKTVTYPIEKAVSAVSDVKFVESKSRQGLSTVRLWMNWGADVNNGQTEVIQRIQQILNSLPTGIKQPFIVRALGYVADCHGTQPSIVRIDDERGVFLSVNKQPGANTIAVVDQVKKLLPTLLGVPPGVKVGITFDQSIYIRRAIESLWD